MARGVLCPDGIMSPRLFVLGLSIVSTVNLIGCATEDATDDCQPGDADCADTPTPTADGKSDAWDSKNNPRAMDQHFEFHLDKLPKTGGLTKPTWAKTYPEAVGKSESAWADTYWPASDGSHNT